MPKYSLQKVKRQTAGVKRPPKRANGCQTASISPSVRYRYKMKSRPEADSSPKNNLISITALEWIFLWDLHKPGLNLRIPFSYHCRISMFNFYYFVVQGRCFKVLWTIRANLLSQVLYKIRNKLVIWYRILGQSPYLEGESPKSRGEPTFLTKKKAGCPAQKSEQPVQVV